MSKDLIVPGDVVWVMPWETTTSEWPLGHREIGIVCSESKKISLVGETYKVMVTGVLRDVPRDAIEKVKENEETQ